MFNPAKLRPFVQNWEAVAEALIHRVHREAVGGAPDSRTAALLKELLCVSGRPAPMAGAGPHGGVVTFLARRVPHSRPGNAVLLYGDDAGEHLQDITLQEIRIECFFPGDPYTEQRARDLVAR